jgi:hypothetical protein
MTIATQLEDIMSKFPAFRTLVLGATMAGGFIGLAAQSHAMMTADEFLASISQMKRICHTLEEPFIIKRNNYGCGKYECKNGRCHTARIKKRRPQRPTVARVRPIDSSTTIEESQGGDGDNDNGSNAGGNPGGRGNGPAGRSSAK